MKDLASKIDHTLLKPEATLDDVKRMCAEAKRYQFAGVCVHPCYISEVAGVLKGSKVLPITVVGFPLGTQTTATKVFEACEAVKNGAQEIDMVINIGKLKSKDYGFVLDEIRDIVNEVAPHTVKVILENGLLSKDELIKGCELAKAAGAHFVKSSTGFGASGATIEDIALMRKSVGPTMGVKASGGIRTLEQALQMLQAGANRIGTSSGVAMIQEIEQGPFA